ncbi:hypothetical protein [Aliivibrio sp. S10_S31]|uniref:hypothetical protein n=1 Tax=Aliivibrio sp. S10_S31 TaxID=2720224 RepID=UPI001680172E|nr:hypothetical protein [Aliivibrio sp. S10_S31]MBD1571560.1 hypothetical protein [Aliivibrio sp. S10_S31]
MNNQKQLVACSIMVAPVRRLVFYKLRTWLDQVVKIVVHTFVVEESKIPLNPKDVDGYWYCAGDFCNTDEAGVYQDLSLADIDYARCLVEPNIKDDHPNRENLVISGVYGVHYVCHNITNRVLYATEDKVTLSELNIKTTGYPLVVKSALGVYGQNKVEWNRKKQRCSNSLGCNVAQERTTSSQDCPEQARYDEINKIHHKVSEEYIFEAHVLTDLLSVIDSKFYNRTLKLVNDYDNQLITWNQFNFKMIEACNILFSDTVAKVGLELTKKIYPDCIIENNFNDTSFVTVDEDVECAMA